MCATTDDTVDALVLGARYRAILEHSPTAIVILDRTGVVLEVRKAAGELMSMPTEQLLGARMADRIAGELRPLLERALRGEHVSYEGPGSPALPEGELWVRAESVPIRDACGAAAGAVVIIQNATQEKRAQNWVERLAFTDPVTELPNHAMLSMVLSQALSGAKASQGQLALVWLNLDRFQDVNDALGPQAGDELLRTVGERLHEHLRTNDMVAHVGADDFVLLLPRINSPKHLERLTIRINDVFAAPFASGAEELFLSASCGIVVHPGGDANARQLQDNAHSAMRTAKELGGGAFEIFDSDGVNQGSARLWLAREIRASIAQDHFTLHYQPLVDLATMRAQAVEALARWQHPERGLLWPAEFIPFAEESGLIVSLGQHLLGQACGQLRSWQKALASPPRLAINISAREVQRSDICGEVNGPRPRPGWRPPHLRSSSRRRPC